MDTTYWTYGKTERVYSDSTFQKLTRLIDLMVRLNLFIGTHSMKWTRLIGKTECVLSDSHYKMDKNYWTHGKTERVHRDSLYKKDTTYWTYGKTERVFCSIVCT